jgi:hypothetical protein
MNIYRQKLKAILRIGKHCELLKFPAIDNGEKICKTLACHSNAKLH